MSDDISGHSVELALVGWRHLDNCRWTKCRYCGKASQFNDDNSINDRYNDNDDDNKCINYRKRDFISRITEFGFCLFGFCLFRCDIFVLFISWFFHQAINWAFWYIVLRVIHLCLKMYWCDGVITWFIIRWFQFYLYWKIYMAFYGVMNDFHWGRGSKAREITYVIPRQENILDSYQGKRKNKAVHFKKLKGKYH